MAHHVGKTTVLRCIAQRNQEQLNSGNQNTKAHLILVLLLQNLDATLHRISISTAPDFCSICCYCIETEAVNTFALLNECQRLLLQPV